MAEAAQIEPQAAAGPLTQAQISSFKEYELPSSAPRTLRPRASGT